jgi:ABC-type antimicrobial peptide transport system permease subunit
LAALGILNTQRMSALERHREFGVMQAIGMSPRRVFAAVLWETTLLTLAGAVVGAGMGTAVNLYFAEYGLDLGLGSFSFMGTNFSTTIEFVVTVAGTVTPVLAILPVALLCGLWPAVSSARLNPANAISKRD